MTPEEQLLKAKERIAALLRERRSMRTLLRRAEHALPDYIDGRNDNLASAIERSLTKKEAA